VNILFIQTGKAAFTGWRISHSRGNRECADSGIAARRVGDANDKGRSDIDLETEHYKLFHNTLNDCGIHVFRYTFIPFNNIGAKPHKTKF
jgi:hypothetical protein